MKNLRRILCLLFAFFPQFCASQSLSFDFNVGAAGMVNHFVGHGISVSNVTGTYSQNSIAKFSNGNLINLGIDSGIVLSTGNLNVPMGLPSNNLSAILNTPGDIDLTQTFGFQTYDAQSVSFDFCAASDSVEFSFIFLTEDYNEYVTTSFFDVFALLISGPGYLSTTNLGCVPGTTVPININTVNNGYSPGASTGPCTNCSYFRDNLLPGPPVQIGFDGLTTVITVRFRTYPTATYNFKIAIADGLDRVIDSAIMLKKNSFKIISNLSLYTNGQPATGTLNLCTGGSITLTAPTSNQYYWSTGDTTQSITINQPGIYECMFFEGICFGFAQVQVIQSGNIQTPVISQNGNILEAPNLIPGPGIIYQWSLNGVDIPGEINPTLNISGNGCYRLTIYEGVCESTSNELCITNSSLQELSINEISVHPNPVTTTSKILNPFAGKSASTLKIYEVSGKLLRIENNIISNEIYISADHFKNGIYFIELINSDSREIFKNKVVILTEKK